MAMLICAIVFIIVFIRAALAGRVSFYIAIVMSAAVLVGDSIAAYIILTRPSTPDNQ